MRLHFSTCFLLLLSSVSQAVDLVTFEFEARVTRVDQTMVHAIAVGDVLSGSYSFDPNTQASSSPPTSGWADAVKGWRMVEAGGIVGGASGVVVYDIEDDPIYIATLSEVNVGQIGGTAVNSVTLAWRPTQVLYPQYTPPRVPLFGGSGYLYVRTAAAPVAVLAELTRVTRQYHATSADSLNVSNVWRGKPIPEQVPGSAEKFSHAVGKINTALWFNDAIDSATIEIGDRYNQISSPRLHCGLAGQEGPRIWQEEGTFEQISEGKQWIFEREGILENDASERCGISINTIASLRAAAQQRLIYLEYDRDGVRHRAQLWPKGLFPIAVATFASYEQVIERQYPDRRPAKAQAKYRATETAAVLNEIGYLLNDSYGGLSEIERAELYCAPAGQVGVRIADLPSRSASYQPLRSSDLTPTDADGLCGMEINTIASLVEAWLQGRLYMLVHKADGLLLRGQIPHP